MGTVKHDMLRGAIRATLAHRAGDSPDAGTVAEATISTWHQMVAQLAPVIGVRGVDVLFSRALHLASTSFPWLAFAEEQEVGAAQQASFKAQLEISETAVAAEASCTLLVTFTEQLATLIGSPLTERLLRPVWASPSPASDQEIAT